MYYRYHPENLTNARSLRREMTPEERHLWYDFLKSYPVKFYKQRRVKQYIVDFYCRQARLVIEIDGGQHYEEDALRYDEQRNQLLERCGLYVMTRAVLRSGDSRLAVSIRDARIQHIPAKSSRIRAIGRSAKK